MKLIKVAPFAVAGLLVVAGCSPDAGLKESLGTLGGAALGGLAGAQIGDGTGQLAATAAGALIGAVVGREVGSSLDKADQLYAERSAQNTLEHNSSASPDSGRTPIRAITAL